MTQGYKHKARTWTIKSGRKLTEIKIGDELHMNKIITEFQRGRVFNNNKRKDVG